MDDDGQSGRRLVRLVWRWRESGTTGSGPWTHRSDVVEGWLQSLTRRSGEWVEHWIETESSDPVGETRDARPDDRTASARE